MKNKSVGFRLSGIQTKQFAIIDSAYTEGEKLSLSTSISFGAADDSKIVSASTKFEFDQRKKVFMLIETACHFKIDEETWDSMLNMENQIELPRDFAIHLILLTVGTARGVLHAKTENTPFNKFPLPTINIEELITEDVKVQLNNA